MEIEKQRREKMNEYVINNYKNDEKMMVLIFAQWCVNNDVDPFELYEQAYPGQRSNKLLAEMMPETIEKEKADEVNDETVLNVLQIFGNDDLAFVVQRFIDGRTSSK